MLHYSEGAEERTQVEAALEIAEKVLRHINESIREQEGTERLKTISQNLWIGEGYVQCIVYAHLKTHLMPIIAGWTSLLPLAIWARGSC